MSRSRAVCFSLDVELVALQKIVLQSLGEQVEVLVKERLRGDVEADDCPVFHRSARYRRVCRSVRTKFYSAEIQCVVRKLHG